MKVFPLQIVTCFTTSLFLASFASAQCPIDPLNNTSWAFHTEAADYNSFGGTSSIGSFKISRIADSRNIGQFIYSLTGSMTVNAGNRIVRLAPISGKPQLEGAGGTLQFADGGQGVLWQFVFANNCKEMNLVNEVYLDNQTLNKVMDGKAVKIESPAACPPNAFLLLDPAFAPTGWSFHAESSAFLPGTFGSSGSASIGTLLPRYVASGGTDRRTFGTLSAVVSTNVGSFTGGSALYRLAPSAGTYQVYPDCSGGTMQLQLGPYATQFEFVFADPTYSQLFLLSTNVTAYGSRSDLFSGVAKKF